MQSHLDRLFTSMLKLGPPALDKKGHARPGGCDTVVLARSPRSTLQPSHLGSLMVGLRVRRPTLLHGILWWLNALSTASCALLQNGSLMYSHPECPPLPAGNVFPSPLGLAHLLSSREETSQGSGSLGVREAVSSCRHRAEAARWMNLICCLALLNLRPSMVPLRAKKGERKTENVTTLAHAGVHTLHGVHRP